VPATAEKEDGKAKKTGKEAKIKAKVKKIKKIKQ
jgi:hypothetical protein